MNNGQHPIDDNIALQLQARYHKGERQVLGMLYSECRFIAIILGKSICQIRKILIQPELLREISHDVASNIVARYLKRPDYQVRSFRALIHLEVLNRLTEGRHRNRHRDNNPPLSIESAWGCGQEDRLPDQPENYFQDILSEHQLGRWIVLQLMEAGSYRKAIKAIARHVERRWIMDRAVKLRSVYNTLRANRVTRN